MIFQAIDIIKVELNNALISAELGNIGEIVSGTGNNHGVNADIIISLINIEENRVSRDPTPYVRNDSGIRYKNPAIHLNLTLLFTSVKHSGGYESSLQSIQQLIEFFQTKYVFDHINTPALDPGIEKIILELLSLNLEQLHQLWSMLGGKYHPSVAYRMRMVTIDKDTGISGPLITEIETNYHLK